MEIASVNFCTFIRPGAVGKNATIGSLTGIKVTKTMLLTLSVSFHDS
jgi:hypothetical protein